MTKAPACNSCEATSNSLPGMQHTDVPHTTRLNTSCRGVPHAVVSTSQPDLRAAACL